MSPYIAYSSVYFSLYAAAAVILGFVPLYAESLGYTRFQIAWLSAAANIAGVVSGPLILDLVHHRVPPRKMLGALSLFSVLTAIPLFFITDFRFFYPIWLACLFAYTGSTVLCESRAVRESASGVIRFERVRIAGSIGFIVTGFLCGLLLDLRGPSVILWAFFFVMLGIWLSAMQVTPRFPEKVSGFTPEKPRTGALQILQQPGFLLLLGAVALTWASHGPLYVYLSLYLKGLGWSGQMISLAWNVGVFAEILVFSFFYRLEGRFALMTIFRVSIFLALVRWLILANFTNPLCILASQALHAFSFGAFYLASIKLAFRTLPDDMRDRGQGFLTGLGSGLGSFLGRMAAGLPGEALTTPELLRLVFWGAAAASIIALTFSAFVPSPQEDGIGKT